MEFKKKIITQIWFWKQFSKVDFQSCVTNNGYLSPYFKLGRGIRQGCPVSALLFLVVAEVVANVLCEAKNVKGLHVRHTCIKLCQLADNMTLFLKDTISV